MFRLRPFLIILVGLALGIGLGLYLGWVAWPTEFSDANPSVLQETYRQDYVRLIAAAYTADNNLSAAQQRVASLGSDGQDVVLTVTLDTILQGGEEADIRQLVRLAADLGLSSPAMTPYLPEANP
ncbi:MAG: hypothetical protein H6667_14310 [Ardenticatenaceae bacterium]|nr:hypothetical protein [Ardenticatenaceae bacterium]MCB9444228.1 hypothetical protein [Ardenticatenaceae bacterium]